MYRYVGHVVKSLLHQELVNVANICMANRQPLNRFEKMFLELMKTRLFFHSMNRFCILFITFLSLSIKALELKSLCCLLCTVTAVKKAFYQQQRGKKKIIKPYLSLSWETLSLLRLIAAAHYIAVKSVFLIRKSSYSNKLHRKYLPVTLFLCLLTLSSWLVTNCVRASKANTHTQTKTKPKEILALLVILSSVVC